MVDTDSDRDMVEATLDENVEIARARLQGYRYMTEIPTDIYGRIPLRLAAREGHKEVMEHLVEAAKWFEKTTKEGDTSTPTTRSSFSFESFINAKDMHGWTPLHLAARQGNKEVVKCLIEAAKELFSTYGSSYSFESFINAKDNYGLTPLDLAARGRKEAQEALFKIFLSAKGALPAALRTAIVQTPGIWSEIVVYLF